MDTTGWRPNRAPESPPSGGPWPAAAAALLDLVQSGRLTADELKIRRQRVQDLVLSESPLLREVNFRTLSVHDLRILFEVLDATYFEGLIGMTCAQRGHRLEFRLSKRMTSCGGTTTMHLSTRSPEQANRFEIAVATTLLFQTFRSDAAASVGGLECRDRLTALQRIMEHELIHLIEMILWNDSNCRGARFRQIIFDFFGHLESNHQLLTPTDIARCERGIRPGDRVRFGWQGRTLEGVVNRITKRATILVADQRGMRYSDGKRYHKYYVPISMLERI